ncbi:glycoside hydrolase family 2 protein [Paractinoplanes lichenicola]|uniref:glycoside hydrolase family 2 protein n=1 Tax=Paractinoplanes lichenicola TaxID=2802976 RepID=UPI001F28126D|nr:glycoside hydrolase family 2 protein [Actinoplanes lichenicola]
MRTSDLSGPWTLNGPPGSLAATVPGCVHTDLLAVGKIVDPFLGENEKAVDWVGRANWVYSRDIAWEGPRPDRIDLVFDGLDTVADIDVAGVVLGSTRNMHRGYRFDVTELVGATSSPLHVRFTSAYAEAARLQAQLGERPNAYPEPFNFVRKMACSFGWDWGPTLVTAGIWRGVRLEGWNVARLSEVKPLLTYADGRGHLDLTVRVERLAQGRSLRMRVLLDDRELFDGAWTETLTLDVDNVQPWHPRGYGEPSLYGLTVVLLDGDDELDRWERRTGFRSVHIDETDGQFVFHVNGEPVFVKGVNWIPDDIFPARMTRERYALRLGQAAAAGANMIRVWGGGIYESRDFYEVCDELGLLVWQDFLFACACYPEEEPLYSEVVAEARENVVRLAAHPSLVAWNGNNENLWLHGADNWAARPGGELSWGETYYLKTLPDIVSETDPSRPYMAGSPWSGSWEHEPNDVDHGTFHSWDVWNREDYLNYRNSAPRFVAEFGWQAPPAWRTLREAVIDDPMRPDSPGVLHHQKAIDGNGKLARGLDAHFPAPRSTEAWHYLTQLNQVRAVRTGIAHWRSHWPHTAGTIVWQLNDLWPVISWSAIDGAGRYKPLYFELAALYAPRTITIQPRDGGLVVALMNDHAEPWTGVAHIARLDRSGGARGVLEVPFSVNPRANTLIPIPSELSNPRVGVADGGSGLGLTAGLNGPRVGVADGGSGLGLSAGLNGPRVGAADGGSGLGLTAGLNGPRVGVADGGSGLGLTAGAGDLRGGLADTAKLSGGGGVRSGFADGEIASDASSGTADGGGPSDVLLARAGGVRDLWFFEDFDLGDPGLRMSVAAVDGGLDVTVEAAGVARDVLLQADRIHPLATVDRGFVTLLPGESTVFQVRCPVALDPALIEAPWVLTDLSTVLRE